MRSFTRYAWTVVGFLILVILWGAVVRATGSGAGCGRHWPLCNGVVVPTAPRTETLIELSHRITSSLAGVLVFGLLIWSRRAFPSGSLTRRAAAWTFAFVLFEGALGAGLVLLELVEGNASVWRAIAISLHLVNTFVLLGWAVLTAWSSRVPDVHFRTSREGRLMVGGLAFMAVVSAAGAVTALGDTLFLDGTLGRQLGEENVAQYFLVQLRIIHPILAVALALYLIRVALHIRRTGVPRTSRLASPVLAIVGAQVLLGVMSILTKAPLALQLGHLLMADLLWITLLCLTFEVYVT